MAAANGLMAAHPAADALLAAMAEHRLAPDDIAAVTAHVHQGAIDVLGSVTTPSTVHQAKFNMGTVLGLCAYRGYAGVNELEHDYAQANIAVFRERVAMVLDEEADRAYPARWIGKVSLSTRDGRTLHARVDEPKGDPGNTLSREDLATKFVRLAAFSHAASEDEAHALLEQAWRIADAARVGALFEAVL